MEIEKYSPKWLLEKINASKTDAHKLMHIIEYRKELVESTEKQFAIHSVSNSLPTNDVDEINGNFAQAERALLRIDPSSENPDPTEIYELLQWFRDKLLGNDC